MFSLSLPPPPPPGERGILDHEGYVWRPIYFRDYVGGAEGGGGKKEGGRGERGGADSQMARKFGVSRATKDEEEKGKFVSVSPHRIQHSPEKKKNRPKDSRKMQPRLLGSLKRHFSP